MAKNSTPNVGQTADCGPAYKRAEDDPAFKKLCDILEELTKPKPEASNFGKVGCIYNQAGEVESEVWVKCEQDGTLQYYRMVDGQSAPEPYSGNWRICDDQHQEVIVETGCIQDRSSYDFSTFEHVRYIGAVIDGEPLSMFANDGWNTSQFAVQVNSIRPGTFVESGTFYLQSARPRQKMTVIIHEDDGAGNVNQRELHFKNNGYQQTVEIVKKVNKDNSSIIEERVWSPDGTEEFTEPYPNNRYLSVGSCGAGVTSGGEGGGCECEEKDALGIQESWG